MEAKAAPSQKALGNSMVSSSLRAGRAAAFGLMLTGLWLSPAMAQAPVDGSKPGDADRSRLSDSERAQRDANRVMSLIKFHAVRQAAPAPAVQVAVAPKPVPQPVRATAAMSTYVAAAPTPTSAAVSTKAIEHAPLAGQVASASAAMEDPRTLPPVSPDPVPAPISLPQEQPVSQPAPAPAAEEEDTTIKMIKYVAPELTQRAISSVNTASAVVRVRFTVMPDGSVSKAAVIGANVPRALGQVATKAVDQWRFEPIKEARDVEVGVDFRFE